MPPAKSNWSMPVPPANFHLTQAFAVPDSVNYPVTGHHPGVDYGTQGSATTPLFYVTDGEVIESSKSNAFGNYFFLYCPGVDRTFVYFHLRDKAPQLGAYKGGQVAGIAGATGLAYGIHLHLECMRGRQNSTTRAQLLTSYANLLKASEDGDAFLRARLPA